MRHSLGTPFNGLMPRLDVFRPLEEPGKVRLFPANLDI
jgi:hypothetical protein